MSISYSNYRSSLYDIKDEDNADSNTDDSNRDFDRFVVSTIRVSYAKSYMYASYILYGLRIYVLYGLRTCVVNNNVSTYDKHCLL